MLTITAAGIDGGEAVEQQRRAIAGKLSGMRTNDSSFTSPILDDKSSQNKLIQSFAPAAQTLVAGC
jgi:hypothetical protein